MSAFEFLSYEPVKGEKYMGLATVRAWGKIILKFKIVENKEGTGVFSSVAAYKTGVRHDGREKFESAFALDSIYESNQLKAFIENHMLSYVKVSTKAA